MEIGLTQSALDTTGFIFNAAKSSRNNEQVIKALLYRMHLMSMKEEDALVKSIMTLRREIAESSFPVTPVLYMMLGEAYRHYYNSNRYRFLNRTQTTGVKPEDISTWDLRTIMEKTSEAYMRSCDDAENLRQIRIDSLREIVHHNGTAVELQPTLYDLLTDRAIDFFSIDDNELTRAAFEFTCDDPDYFAPVREFTSLNITSRDSSSLKYHALLLLQDLVAFHAKDPSPEALIHADLKRLEFVRKRSILPDKDSLYLHALQTLEKRFRKHPSSTEVTFAIASLYTSWAKTYDPPSDRRYRWMYGKAIALCGKAVKAFPESYGASQCRRLSDDIREKELDFTVEAVNLPDVHSKVLVSWKNIGSVHWRIVRIPVKEFRVMMDRPKRDSVAKALADRKAVKEWSTRLPDPGDYQKHSAEIAMPAMPQGQYAILCSSHPDFTCKKQAVVWAAAQVSDIMYRSRRRDDGKLDLQLLSRRLGTPLSGATVTAWERVYNERKRRHENRRSGTCTTGENGFAKKLPVPGKRRHYFHFDCSNGNDLLLSNRSYSYFRTAPGKKMRLTTFFFTDRALYRPGQTVYFKGILLNTDGEKSTVAAGKKTKVTFYNVNHQEVAHLDLVSSDFGSVHGSFTAPVNTLNGRMHITNGSGSQYFSVEEYKRPKFSVTVGPGTGEKRLGDTVRMTGTARAYTGAPVNGAKVNYRIVRRARFPRYWWHYRIPPRRTREAEFGSGTVTTDDTGGFFIDFAALPDRSIPESDNPLFTFSITVDVTDITGETQSTSGSVTAGYRGLLLSMQFPDRVGNDSALTVPLSTSDANGDFQPASGTITIYRLETPASVIRKRRWNLPDTVVMSRNGFRKKFPFDVYRGEDDITTWKRKKRVYKTEFNTGKARQITLKNFRRWKPGVYAAEGTATDRRGEEVTDTRYFTVYSQNGKNLPSPQPDWFVPVKDSGEPGETAVFLAGSAFDNVRMYYEIEHKGKITKKTWLTVDNEQKKIEIPIREKHRGNFSIHLSFVRENRAYHHTATVTVPWTNRELDISFETFRDRLTPGEKEQWRLKISGKGKDRVAAEMVAALYDASLDAFRPHDWTFNINPWYHAERRWSTDEGYELRNGSVCSRQWNPYTPVHSRQYPSFNWFGYRFESGYRYPRMKSMLRQEAEVSDMAEGAVPAAPARLAKKVVADTEMFSKGGFAADIDENLQGVGGLKNAGNGGHGTGGIPEPDLTQVAARRNLNETAFFFPVLTTNKNSEVIVNFTVPEALTRWNMLGFAHTKDLCYGKIQNSLVTRKELMAVPNPPRFFRENDCITFTAKVSNLSENSLTGNAQLFLFDAATTRPLDKAFGNRKSRIPFKVKKGQSSPLAWNITVPEGIGAVTVRVVAKSGKFSDGEEQIIPVLSNRLLVTESLPLSIRKKGTEKRTFDNLVSRNNGSKSLRNHRLTLEFTSNPAWYAIQALPYLIEYPYECAEQVFSRLYANSIASHIVNSSPRIKAVFDQWRTRSPDALLSNLEKNSDLKSLALEETPWLLDGKNESERKKRIALLFDLNRMADQRQRALDLLKKMQLSNGGWPWFDGMPDNRYITQYITTGLARLDHLGVIRLADDRALDGMAVDALQFLDNRIREDYERVLKEGQVEKDNLGELQIQYLYMRSFFGNIEVAQGCRAAYDYYFGQVKKYWLKKRRYMQGMIALALNRENEKKIAGMIMRSLRENAIVSEEMGMYWKEMYEGYSWWWYEAPIESQALLIEAFEEVAHDTAAVEELKVWLLKSKQTQNWPTTRSTAEACYALLLRGMEWLGRSSKVTLQLGDTLIDPEKREDVKKEAGTGYFTIAWSGKAITAEMGNVTVTKEEPGIAWGALYWQYFEQLDKIRSHETPLKLQKELFLKRNSPTGPKISPVTGKTRLTPGDRLTVRIELRVDRDMEYVHMKDMRASGFEPLNVFSGCRWQDGLSYYESTRDASTNFFFSYLDKGTYVFEYPLVVSHKGDFSNGITTIQCMYAPEFASHSEGVRVKVGK